MPQASDELREKMQDRFGGLDDWPAWQFLAERGYTQDRGVIRPPTPEHFVTNDEGDCIDFLFQEWDWAYKP